MKNYNNGPRKSGSYACGGKTRKPMMYGGMATPKKKPRKKAQAGGMMSTTQPQQNMQRRNQMQPMGMPMMAEGGRAKSGRQMMDDISKELSLPQESGTALSNADRKRIRAIMNKMSDEEKDNLAKMIQKNFR
jgi:hypothetical protein